MSDLIIPKLPETKYEVTAQEFLNVIHGGIPEEDGESEAPWFYTATRFDIELDDDLIDYTGYLDDEMEYIVLKEAKIPLPQYEHLLLEAVGSEDEKVGLVFYKCILPRFAINKSLLSDLVLINTHIQNITIESNSQFQDIYILENSQAGSIHIVGNSVIRNIHIDKGSKTKHIDIQKSQCFSIAVSNHSQNENIVLAENSQISHLQVSNNSESEIITADDSKIGSVWIEKDSKIGPFSLRRSQCKSLSVVKNSQTRAISIHSNSEIESIFFSESISPSLSLLEGVRCESLIIAGNSLVADLQIRSAHVKEVSVEDNYCSISLVNATVPIMRVSNCHIHALGWSAGTKGELYITSSLINILNLCKTALAKEAVLSLTNCFIHIIQFYELTIQGQLILRNIRALKEPFAWQPEVKKWVKEESRPDRYQSIENGYPTKVEALKKNFKNRPLFLLVNSSLGKAEITGSDLELFRLEYRDSRLLEIFISGTKLPPINIYCPSDQELAPRELFEQKVVIYNQLKKIFDNQGDIVEATQYHSRAMDSQKNLLKLVYHDKHQPKWYSINKWFTDEGFDLFNFKLNRISNNHGESWRKAVAFTIGISLFFYTCYYINLNYSSHFLLTWKTFGDFIGNYFVFLNLAHKIDFMANESALNATAKFLDFTGRIVTGYGVYQFIAAFRRHGRK